MSVSFIVLTFQRPWRPSNLLQCVNIPFLMLWQLHIEQCRRRNSWDNHLHITIHWQADIAVMCEKIRPHYQDGTKYNWLHVVWHHHLEVHTYIHADYCIVENFRELVKNTIFTEKTSADCSLLPCQRTPHSKISQRKLSQIATKLAKVFSLESFPLHGRLTLGRCCIRLGRAWVSACKVQKPTIHAQPNTQLLVWLDQLLYGYTGMSYESS